jgi:hypothetical protein
MSTLQDTGAILSERFAELPRVVQNAITSADIEKRLRDLANTHKLHVDQWETLENEVMLALFGATPVDELEKNIEKHVALDRDTAVALASNISKIVFEPIREELERSLEHPEAKAEEVSGVESVRSHVLADTRVEEAGTATMPESAASVSPGETPAPPPEPSPVPQVRAERAVTSSSYAARTPSAERKTIEGDPYREQVQ